MSISKNFLDNLINEAANEPDEEDEDKKEAQDAKDRIIKRKEYTNQLNKQREDARKFPEELRQIEIERRQASAAKEPEKIQAATDKKKQFVDQIKKQKENMNTTRKKISDLVKIR